MDMKQSSMENIAKLKTIYVKDRSKKLLEFAIKSYDLENGVITTPGGKSSPASLFCMQLNYHMNRLFSTKECPADPKARKNTMWFGITDPDVSYQIIALLLTMERMNRNTWNFGTRLRSALDTSDVKITRSEWVALMAQARVYEASPFDENMRKLLMYNPLAIALYVGEFATVCGSLHNNTVSEKEIPQELADQFNSAVRESPMEMLEAMMDTFIPAYIGKSKESQLIGFKQFLKTHSFYEGPATADAHGNFDSYMNNGIGGGLAIHTIDVLYRLIDILRPQTPAEMGQIVLLSVCHDLSEVGVFQKYYRSEAVLGPAFTIQDNQRVVDEKRTLQWPDQNPYHMETTVVWKREDPILMEAGMKSLHIALGFFCESMSEECKSAIANHRREPAVNVFCDQPMLSNSLCRSLHIADFLASMLGKKVV